MAPPSTLTGARAQLGVVNPNTGAVGVVGIFNNVSYGLTYTADSIYVLGHLSPVETVYTAQEAIHITASGWRVIEKGPHTAGGVPNLDQLLKHEYLTLTLYDRKDGSATPTPIATFHDVRPLSYNTSLANRSASEISITFVALRVSDESGEQAEAPNRTTFP